MVDAEEAHKLPTPEEIEFFQSVSKQAPTAEQALQLAQDYLKTKEQE